MTQKKLFIFGASGLGREIKMLVDQVNKNKTTWHLEGFIDDDTSKKDVSIVGNYKVLGNIQALVDWNEEADVIIAIGDCVARKRIYDQLKKNHKLSYPNLIHPTSIFEKETLKLGKGNVLSTNSIISTNNKIGDFNHIHMNAMVAHDGVMGNFNNIFPGVNVGGYLKMEDHCEIGIGSSVRQQTKIPSNVKIGGCSFVAGSLESNYSYLGVPAKKIFKLKPVA